MQNTRTFTDKAFLVIKGIAMGAANKVPGVSGGVVAFVAGFYEEFIFSLRRINYNAFRLLINGRFRSFYYYTNLRFLLLLIFGMVFSFFSVSKLLDYLIDHYELYVWASFFGMILGSIYYISKDFERWNFKYLSIVLLGVGIGVGISMMEPAQENDNLWFVFLCGIIGVSGMTLPGLSGSFILLLMGNYVLLLVDSVNALYDTMADLVVGDFASIADPGRIRLLQVLVVFSLGSLAGLVSLSHVLGYVLKHYKNATFALIIGFITGSLGVVWPWKKEEYRTDKDGNYLLDNLGDRIVDNYDRYWPNFELTETWTAILFIIFGAMIVFWLAWYEKKKKVENA